MLVTILLAGLALRVVALGRVPFGFHPDEGHNGLDALSIARGARPVFLERNNGREPLFMYVMALLVGTVGPSIYAVRLTAAFSGTLFIAAQAVMARSLPLRRSLAVGMAAAAVAAFTFWPVAQSRYALRAVLLPTFVSLATWAWWRAIDGHLGAPRGRDQGVRFSVLAGVFTALAVYTHLAGRLLPIALVVPALFVAARERTRRPLVFVAVGGLTVLVLAAPLLGYFARHPDMLTDRAGQVSVWGQPGEPGGPLQAVLRNAAALAAAPILSGDVSSYHNLPHQPIFHPLLALGFAVGAGLAARDLFGRRGRRRQYAAVLLGSSLLTMAASSAFSVGAPNYVRLTGAWPALFALAGWGLVGTAGALGSAATGFWSASRTVARSAGVVAAIGAVALTCWSTASHYFRTYAADPETYVAFNGAAAERGLLLAAASPGDRLFVSPALWRQSVIRFLAAGRDVTAYDASTGLVLPASGRMTYALEASEVDASDGLARRWPWLAQSQLVDTRGVDALSVHTAEASAWRSRLSSDASLHRRQATSFAGLWSLAGASALPSEVTPGAILTVTLVWQVAAPSAVDLNRFVHVTDDRGASIGQLDGPPLGGSYTTDRWRPGETVIETLAVPVSAEASPGTHGLVEVGWYDWRDGRRLPADGEPDDAVGVGLVRVRAPGPPAWP